MLELRPHQRNILPNIKNGTVLTGGVGTGKTITSLFYYYEVVMGGVVGDYGSIKTPKDIYVFTTARKRDELDWQETAAQMGVNRVREASAAGVQLVVDSYNNIQKYVGVTNAFIILDEQRMVGAGAWTKTFLKMAKSNQWIMLSATPGDKWEDYIPLFIANGFYKNRTEFVRRHCVYSYYGKFPKLERYLEVNRLQKLKNSILVEMPYERHTKRHLHTVPVEYDKDLFEKVVKKRWHVYEERPLRDVSELFSVMRKVVNSDPSRLEKVRGLLEKHPRLIVFYNFDYELEMLRTLSGMTVLSPELPTSNIQSSVRSESQTSNLANGSIETDKPFSESSISLTASTATSPFVRSATESSSVATQSKVLGSHIQNNQPSWNPLDSQPIHKTTQEKTWEPNTTTLVSSTTSMSTGIESRYSTPSSTSPTSQKSSQASGISTLRESSSVGATDLRSLENTESFRCQPSSSSPNGSQQDIENQKKASKSTTSTKDITEQTGTTSSSSVTLSESTPTSDEYNVCEGAEACVIRHQHNSAESSDSGSSGERSSDTTGMIGDELGRSEEEACRLRTDTTSTTPSISSDSDSGPGKCSNTTELEVSEWNGHKHEAVPTGPRWAYIVQYVAGAEAWNCVTTNAVAFWSLTYSYKNFEQAQGRIDRLNTPWVDLHYYILLSKSPIDRAVSGALKQKKTFNEKDFDMYV